jgi:hypothetical protein
MTDAFDIRQNCSPKAGGGTACWTYTATPSTYLLNTTLPIPGAESVDRNSIPKPTHDAAWWAAKTKGLNFKAEDLNDPQAFNRIIWEGMVGNKPYPTMRSGAVIRHGGTPQPESKQVSAAGGSK